MDYKYWAFISYSHQDNLVKRATGDKHCIRWANWLHDTLETWQVPVEFRQRRTGDDELMPERIFPVFQDEKELPISADLGGSIRQALDTSRFLVVICSPRSAASFYVNEEVRYFKQLGRADRILALIVDGEPNASDGNKRGFGVEDECFCPALRQSLLSDGTLDFAIRAPQEAIAGDVRIKTEGRVREAVQGDWKAHRDVLDFMKLKLLAGLIGVGFDELAQRDKARSAAESRARVRRWFIIAAAFAVIGVGAVIAAIVAVGATHRAEAERVTADRAIVAVGATHRAEAERVTADQQRVLADYQKTQADQQRAKAEYQKTQADQQRVLAEQNEKEAVRQLGDLYEEKGRQGLLAGDPASAAPYLVAAWKIFPDRPEMQLLAGLSLQPLQGQRLTLNGHAGQVHQVRWSPDGKLIASTDDTGTIILWAADDGHILGQFDMSGNAYRQVMDLIFTPDSQELIATGDQGDIALFHLADLPTVKPAMLIHNSFGRIHGAVSLDGKFLATVGDGTATSAGQEVKVWQLPSGTNVASFGDALGNSVHFSKDGKRLVVASDDRTVRIWDWAAKAIVFEAKGDGGMNDAIFTPSEEHVMGTGTANLLVSWETTSGARVIDIKPGPGMRKVYSLENSNDGRFLLTVTEADGNILDRNTNPPTGHDLGAALNYASFNNGHLSPDGKYAVLCPSLGEQTAIWDSVSGQEVAPLVGQQGEIFDAAFSPDSRQVVIAGGDHRLIVWDWPKVALPPPLPDDKKNLLAARFGAPDRIITATAATIRLWKASDATLISEIPPVAPPALDPGTSASALGGVAPTGDLDWAASPDGLHLAVAGPDKMVRLYDGRTGEPGPVITIGSSHPSLVFSPDGMSLVTTHEGTPDAEVRVWNVATGAQSLLLSQKFSFLSDVRFTPSGDGLLLLTIKDPPTVWDLAANKLSAQFKVDAGFAEKCAFSPGGGQAFIVTSDSRIRAWNLKDGTVAFSVGPFSQGVTLMNFSADGKVLGVFAGNGTVYFFDGTNGKSLSQWDTPNRLPISDLQFWPNSHFAVMAIFNSVYFFDPNDGQSVAKIPGNGMLSNIHFSPDGTHVLVSEGKHARFLAIFHPVKDAASAAEEVDRLDRWKLVDGRLIAK